MRAFPSTSVCAALVLATSTSAAQSSTDQWWAYGRDALGSRFSPLVQITPENVGRLTVAWTYRTGELQAAATAKEKLQVKFEATPLVVDGVLYLATPRGKVIALDPETGRERWVYDARVKLNEDYGDIATRGVSTFVDPRLAADAHCRRRIYAALVDARLVALDARDGRPCTDFGAGGTTDLKQGLRNGPGFEGEYEITSPPAVVGGLLVVGSSVGDNNRTNAASGEVRGVDARTGAVRWTWDPVPRDSADPAWHSWRGVMAHTTGAANAWSVIVADPARDLVFVPTGSASPDYYGGERLGDNRYANSVVALRASTGKVVWSFQAVHHDLWDYDVASPPALVTITHDGRRVDAVLQATKTGQLFVLDRDTGTPLFPVEERPVPASDVFGEHASSTQPFNSVVPALSPQGMSASDAWGPTPADADACRAQLSSLRNDGIFTPPSLRGTLVMPSNIGGAHWGGVAVDVEQQIAVVPVNRIAAMVQLIPVDRFDMEEAHRESSRLGYQYTRMHGTPYMMRRRIMVGPSGLPCTPPPFGALVGIDLRTGKQLWNVPLGDMSALGAKPAPTPLGSPNLGGPFTTASHLVFIGATMDHALRAFDVRTGRELWKGALPGGARATPMTYQSASGRQFVVVSVGGSETWGEGDYLVAFALPRP
ncbi:MAG TPA: pyrroloquinoline quinone-dependent dehydrogenase [Gemmatimonadaceae bacterium]|jgi:quinoprotein glucose dehydrogenase